MTISTLLRSAANLILFAVLLVHLMLRASPHHCHQRTRQRDSSPALSAGLMPTDARGNYLPEAPAPYLRETKTYLFMYIRCSFDFIAVTFLYTNDATTCNSRMQCMGTSYMCNSVWLSLSTIQRLLCSAVHFHNPNYNSLFIGLNQDQEVHTCTSNMITVSFSTKLAANRNFLRLDLGEFIDQLSQFYHAQHLVFEAHQR